MSTLLVAVAVAASSLGQFGFDPCQFQGGDNDGDGCCAFVDFNDDDPGVCADPCQYEGGDADGDGVCANQDYDDSNPGVTDAPEQGGGAGSTAPDASDVVTEGLTVFALLVGIVIASEVAYRVIRMGLRWMDRAGG
jgi:hypothetical protein